MVYKIKMRRKSLFYIVNIIIPTFLLSFLSVCVFYLPTNDGEKITLSLSILFALGIYLNKPTFIDIINFTNNLYITKVVFFLLIAKIIPPTSIVVPLISKYLLFTFIMNIVSVLNTCIVISLYYKRLNLEQLHPCLRYFLFGLMPMVLFLKRKKVASPHTSSNLASKKLNHRDQTNYHQNGYVY